VRRLFWAALGAAAGAVIAGRITRVARGCTPTGTVRSAADLLDAVRRDTARRERELRREFGMDGGTGRAGRTGTVTTRGTRD